MAINLNDSMYGAQFSVFRELASQANLTQDTLVSVDEAGRGKGLLGQNGERRTIVVKNGDTIRPLFGRSQGHKDLNNEVRNLFKETVLRVCGAKTLEELPKAVLDVMKKGDYDNEGHPLSLRRIRAVTNAIIAEADREAKAGVSQEESRVSAINDFSTTDVSGMDDGQEREAPGIEAGLNHGMANVNTDAKETVVAGDDEVESSVDDDEVSFKYDTPSYINGLPSETEESFMEFYCDAVDRAIEQGQTKNDCDETLAEMFKIVGYNKGNRKLLVELLVNGKPAFLGNGGAIPFRHEGIRFAEKFKAILDKTEEYRTKLKSYGNIVADTILATLKTLDEMFDVDELPLIDVDLCKQISAVAKNVDTSKLLAPPSSKGYSAKSLGKRLDSFQRQVAEQFRDEILSTNDSQLRIAIKQNLLKNMALAHAGSQKDEFAEAIEEHYDDLADKYITRNLLTEIAPGLKTNL